MRPRRGGILLLFLLALTSSLQAGGGGEAPARGPITVASKIDTEGRSSAR